MSVVRRFILSVLLLVGICGFGGGASALPSYSRQTGDPCTSCHVGSFGPPLTPHGRAFKIGGRTDGKAVIPLSGVVLASFTHTARKRAEPISGHDGRNNNFALQEATVFLAGRILPHFSSFVSVSWSEIERQTKLNHLDMRYALPLEVGGKDLIWGFDLNNQPTVQDVFGTLPAGDFPPKTSELVPRRAGSPLLLNGLKGQVIGVSTYLWFNDRLYAEIGGYRSLGPDLLDTLGIADQVGRISGIAPYWRFAFTRDLKTQAFSIGLVGMHAAIHPGREPGPTNKYTSWGIDGSYQYLGNRKNILVLAAAYLHERQRLDFELAAGETAFRRHSFDTFNASLSWYHDNHYGLTAGFFHTKGTRDPGLFAPAPETGSRTGRPDNTGFILQADWTPFGEEDSPGHPWANLRLGLQYTAYTKFNGASSNYDGFGRDASDNNTLFAFLGLAF